MSIKVAYQTYISPYIQPTKIAIISEEELTNDYCIYDTRLYLKKGIKENSKYLIFAIVENPKLEDLNKYDVDFEVEGEPKVEEKKEEQKPLSRRKLRLLPQEETKANEFKVKFRVYKKEKYHFEKTYEMTISEIFEKCCMWNRSTHFDYIIFKEDATHIRNKRDLTMKDVNKEIYSCYKYYEE